MGHGERHDLPANFLEQTILLQEHDFGAATTVEIVVDG
jgi:hypothetical protein